MDRKPDKAILVQGSMHSSDEHHVYDFAMDAWTLGPKLPYRAYGHCMEMTNDDGTELVVIGGRASGDGYKNRVELLDLVSGVWTSLGALLPAGRYQHQCTRYKGKIYMTGGLPFRTRVDVLDLSTKALSSYESLPTAPTASEQTCQVAIPGYGLVFVNRKPTTTLVLNEDTNMFEEAKGISFTDYPYMCLLFTF